MKKVEWFSDVEVKSVVFSEPSKTPDKTYYSTAAHLRPEKQPILIQTPSLPCRIVPIRRDNGIEEVELQLNDNAFYQFLRDIDAQTVQAIFQQRHTWFPKGKAEVSMAMVEDCYRSPIVRSEHGNPVVRLRLNYYNDTLQTTVFRGQFKSDIEFLKAANGQLSTAIVQLRGLTLFRDCIQPDWEIHSLRLEEAPIDHPMFSDL